MQVQSSQSTKAQVSSSYLEIVANKIGKITLKVLDVNGRMAKKITTSVSSVNQKLALDLNDLTSGTYVLNAFTDGEFMKCVRFIKQ